MLSTTLSALLLLLGALDDSPHFLEGSSLYQELEFETAIERFRAAALEADRTEQERARLLVWEAMAQAGIGDMEAMEQALDGALALDVDVAVPAIAAPLVRERLEAKRAATKLESAHSTTETEAELEAAVSPASSPSSWRLWTGGGAAGLGFVSLVGAGVAGVLAAGSMNEASRPDAFQTDAANAVQQANNQVALASVLGLGAVVLVGTGTSLLAWHMLGD